MVPKRKSSFKVKRIVAVVWSKRGNRRIRSKELSQLYGPKEKTAAIGQKNCRSCMVEKRKPPQWVKRIVAVVWSKRENRRIRSKDLSQSYGPKEKIVI